MQVDFFSAKIVSWKIVSQPNCLEIIGSNSFRCYGYVGDHSPRTVLNANESLSFNDAQSQTDSETNFTSEADHQTTLKNVHLRSIPERVLDSPVR